MIGEKFNSEEPRFRLTDIFRTMREGIIILRENMTVSASNAAAEETFADSRGELVGRRLSEILRDFELHDAYSRAINNGDSSEVRVEVIDESRRIFDVVVSPLDLGDDYAAIGIFYEVTRIERLERVRQEFLSNISHELRTPLTSIMTFVETLSDGAIDDKENRKRFLEVIRKNAGRMQVLIDDISELSSIEAGQIKLNRAEINLFGLVSDISTNLKAKADKRDIVLKVDIPEGTVVFADHVRLEQMITNLVDNAIKFNRESGSVEMFHSLSESHDVISVIDSGEGIRKEQQDRIFERFYRIDKARSREVGGTGLGLAIVKHLARVHGGEVRVSSSVAEGTRFDLHLPRS